MNYKLHHIYKHIKFFISTFIDKELTLFAASLSFYTIFTIIPLLLIMMTLLTSLPSFLEYYDSIKSFIFSNLMPVNSKVVMGYIDDFLKNSSQMGVLGLSMILVASLLFFKNFEYIANKIFHAKQRTLWESVTTYWTMLTLTPYRTWNIILYHCKTSSYDTIQHYNIWDKYLANHTISDYLGIVFFDISNCCKHKDRTKSIFD